MKAIKQGFMTVNAGGGSKPNITIQFETLSAAHAAHAELLALVSLAEASTPAREAGAVGGWISVDERMPKLDERVQFWCGGGYCVGKWAGEARWKDELFCDVDGEPTSWYTTTHWQPLPPAPLYTKEKAE